MGARGPKPKLYAFDGRALTLQQWSYRTGICVRSIRNRLELGWSLSRALTRPVSHGPDKGWKARKQKRVVVISAEQIFRAWASSPAPSIERGG